MTCATTYLLVYLKAAVGTVVALGWSTFSDSVYFSRWFLTWLFPKSAKPNYQNVTISLRDNFIEVPVRAR